MVITLKELEMYSDFDELSNDVLDLASEILPDKLIYLTSFSNKEQIILKLSTDDTSILLTEGMVINIDETVCNRIDFEKKKPLIYEDIREGTCPSDLKNLLEDVNIRSYLGLPISLLDGERFGTLCVAYHQESVFDKKSIVLLQKIARMFSYYLNLEHLAFKDPLTNLYNRRYLSKKFEDDYKNGGIIFLFDLDGFKKINDIYGHDVGDGVLKEVALILQEFVKTQNDSYAVRLGGDEFLIHFSATYSKAEISKLAENILSYFRGRNTIYQLSTSIGISTYPADSDTDLKTLIKNADNALYRAKEAGKNNYTIFE